MNLMSIDLEMNQPSGKIIQIGAVVFNPNSGAIIERAKFYVNPCEELNPYIIELTGVTQEQVDSADILLDVYPKLVELYKKHKCDLNAIVWGGGDTQTIKIELYQQWELNKEYVEKPVWSFGHRWIDVKTLFQCFCVQHNHRVRSGLAKAMTRVGLAFEGRKHDALDDAYNTARLFIHLIKYLPKDVIKK